MPEIAPGTVIAGRYTVGDRLGSGGMADVYLAHDSELGRNIAIKVLHRRFSDDPGFVGRFRLEAQSAAALQHANIVSVFDRGDWEGTSWIAMEYLQGHTLKEVIREHAPLDPAAATRIGLQIAQAIAFAHRAGVVHRDIKPQNVMVDQDGRATVTDFGIARAGAAGVTEAGSVLGTAHYISPEQAQGFESGPGSDVYSVGIVLYEMLTGRVPFDAETPVAIAMKQVNAVPEAPSATVPGIPADLEALALQCLAKDPEQRPASADELVNRLDSISERLRTSADPGATVAFGAAEATTVPATAVAGVAAGAAAGTTAAGPSVDARQDEQSPQEPPGEKDGSRRKWLIGGAIVAIAAAAVAAFLLFGGAGPQATMPLVVGKDVATATTIIANAGFTETPELHKVTSSQPKGRVLEQHPLANARVAADSKVRLTISDGPGDVQIPTVADLSAAEARKLLEKLGFKVTVRTKASEDVVKDHAIGTDPAAGVSVVKGTQITLFVSSGPAPIVVQDVTGQQASAARSALQAQGFVVSQSSDTSCARPDGTVVSQSPAGGSKAQKGDTVNLVVADASNCATVPEVGGMSKAAATTAFTAAGFSNIQFNISTACGTSPVPASCVVKSQNPPPGASKPKSTKVTATIGQ